MIDFFDSLYSSIKGNNKFLKRIQFYSATRFIIRLVANFIFPIYFKLTKNNKRYALPTPLKRDRRVIVSLTSFPTRIAKVWLVIETILRQTKKPDIIILWLSKEQFSSVDFLPSNLLKQRERGLEIRLEEGDIRSHKKYFYTLLEYPNDYVLTVDDDIYYKSTMIDNLFGYSIRYPVSVIAQYCKEIQRIEDKLKSYALWPTINKETTPNSYSFFGTGGGTLFPPFSLDSDVLNKDIFMSLAPTADDVWLNVMCRLKGTKITQTSYHSTYLPILNSHDITLDFYNNNLNQNDVQINTLREYYIKKRGIDPFAKTLEI